MNTWLLEYETENGHRTLEYSKTLQYAQSLYLKNESNFKGLSILKLRGQRFGEGYHEYRMYRINGKWVKQK